MMKLLLTGSTGHSGLYFLDHLNSNSIFDEVICIIRDESKKNLHSKYENINFRYVIGDLENIKNLVTSIGNIDVVMNIANIKYSLSLVEVRNELNFNWFIGIHTTGVYSKYKMASEEYKNIEEKLDLVNDIDITILRPTMIYGSLSDKNMSRLIKFIHRSPFFPIFGNGKNLMQPVRAQDLGEAYYKVIQNEKSTRNVNYNLSGKREIEYENIIKIIADKLHRKILIVKIPIWFSILCAKIANTFFSKFPINVEQVYRMQEDKVFSHQKATQDFGFDPMDFDKGIEIEVNEYISREGQIK